MKKRVIAFMILIGLFAAPTLYAAKLYGIVSDKNGKPVQTSVILKDAADKAVGEPAATDKAGAYAFTDIKPGTYQVHIGELNEWKIFVGPGETRRDFNLK